MNNEQQKERLTRLIQESVSGCAEYWAQKIAEHLIDNGVIVPPVKIGQTVYERPTKRREGEYVEPSGWWDEFDKPTKTRIAGCNRYCS